MLWGQVLQTALNFLLLFYVLSLFFLSFGRGKKRKNCRPFFEFCKNEVFYFSWERLRKKFRIILALTGYYWCIEYIFIDVPDCYSGFWCGTSSSLNSLWQWSTSSAFNTNETPHPFLSSSVLPFLVPWWRFSSNVFRLMNYRSIAYVEQKWCLAICIYGSFPALLIFN